VISSSISAYIAAFITAAIASIGYAGIIGLMALESACIPLPSEIIMPFAGYLVSTGRFNLLLVATAGAVGCNLGSTVAYLLGALGGRPMVEKWGRKILISRKELERVDHYFQRYGGSIVFVGRLLPVVRTFVSLPAGIAKMSIWKFQLYTFTGSWLWCLALAFAGMKLGEAWNSNPQLHAIMHSFDLVVVIALAAGVIWYVWAFYRNQK